MIDAQRAVDRVSAIGVMWQMALRLLLVCALHPALAKGEEPIVVGRIASTTHPVTKPGALAFGAGVELAFERANRQGGIAGRPLILETVDDGFDADRSAALVDALVANHKVVALIGNSGTAGVLRLAETQTLERHRLASFGPLTGLQAALKKPNVFPIRASYENEVEAMMRHAASVGRPRMALLAFNSGAGKSIAEMAPSIAKEVGINLIASTLFKVESSASAQAELLDQVIRELPSAPESMILIAAAGAQIEAIKATRRHFGAAFPIYTWSLSPPDALVGALQPSESAGVMITQVMPYPRSVRIPLLLEYQDDLKAAGKPVDFNYTQLEGYVAGRIVTEIIRRSSSPTAENVLSTALRSGEINLFGFRVNYSGRIRRSLYPVEITMVGRDGKLVR